MSWFELIVRSIWKVMMGIFYLGAAITVFGSIVLFIYVVGTM